jgi:hypothetical protein
MAINHRTMKSHSSHLCIECRMVECEEGRDGYHLRCSSCEGYNRDTKQNVEVFNKSMRLNPKNNYLTNELYNVFEMWI